MIDATHTYLLVDITRYRLTVTDRQVGAAADDKQTVRFSDIPLLLRELLLLLLVTPPRTACCLSRSPSSGPVCIIIHD